MLDNYPAYHFLRWLNRGLAAAGAGWAIYWINDEPPHYFIAFAGIVALFALWMVIRGLLRRLMRGDYE